ncbi:MAG: YraN family protein [Ruminococcaceae bacterium]|nr:YraN family protein [Oscillospiraceae bacterium]
MDRRTVGKFGETEAVRYLKKKKYEIIDTNYHTKFGEIDIIAKNREYIIFAEVKTRMQGSMFQPRQAVTTTKQNKIKMTAAMYLSRMTENTELQPRFDVIEVIVGYDGTVLKCCGLEHMENAFWS